jgi:diketogulonate reductase-like aldo/keto reductase
VIPKSVTASRIEANSNLFDFKLTPAEMKNINALDKKGLKGCFNHPETPWLGRSKFTGTGHAYNK